MFKGVDEYIDSFVPEVQKILTQIRTLIKKTAPEAQETMGYGVASFKLSGKPLIYYAAFKDHIGVYPVPKAEGKLLEEIKKYQTGVGTMHFLLDEPIPINLIKEIVNLRKKQIFSGGQNGKVS